MNISTLLLIIVAIALLEYPSIVYSAILKSVGRHILNHSATVNVNARF